MPDPAILCCYASICCSPSSAKRAEAGAKMLMAYADEAGVPSGGNLAGSALAMSKGLLRDFILIPRSMLAAPDDPSQFQGGAA